MCGRYVLYEIDELADHFNVEIPAGLHPNYNAAPTQTMPVITDTGLELMRWGLIPTWARDEKIGYKLINARSETVFEKPMWKSIVTKHRCLVPANGFYEWHKQTDGKHPFYIHPKEFGLFSFAGIWSSWKHGGIEWHTYSIMTTKPNTEMIAIHDRMPVILHPDDEALWLSADTHDEIEALLAPYTDNSLELYEVTKEVNTIKANDASLIKALA
jgi:putative SOS response-associated peptidase YedK